MIRRIIRIDEEKCNGCGLCATACHEGAIGMIDGKAKLLREDYCDGLGDCLPACPTGAISFEEREAKGYDEKAVLEAKRKDGGAQTDRVRSSLQQWPVQIKLVPPTAPWLKDARLLIAADCTAYAYANLHNDFMKDKITLIGCPKLDGVNYAEKLEQIFTYNDIRNITVLRMEVPCCGGLSYAVASALKESGKDIPCRVVTIGIDGDICTES